MPHASVENASLTGTKVIRFPKPVIVVLVWTFIACLSYARYYLRDPHHRLWPDILIWAACFDPWALLTPFIFALEKRFPSGRFGCSEALRFSVWQVMGSRISVL
jgi:hypothetical protein